MRLAINTSAIRGLSAIFGWSNGLRLVREITEGPRKGNSILEGNPCQFEALYDQLNQAATKLSRATVSIRAAKEKETLNDRKLKLRASHPGKSCETNQGKESQ